MITVVCSILVSTMSLGFTGKNVNKSEVKGKILGENTYSYLVDFSEEAKIKNFLGDYTRKIVNKNDCVVEK